MQYYGIAVGMGRVPSLKIRVLIKNQTTYGKGNLSFTTPPTHLAVGQSADALTGKTIDGEKYLLEV